MTLYQNNVIIPYNDISQNNAINQTITLNIKPKQNKIITLNQTMTLIQIMT